MNYYYITGTSRGIGKAIAEKLLIDEGNVVIGISRHNSIEHKNFTHVNIDLSNLYDVRKFKFQPHANAQRICLINNAGTIGEIKNVGHIDNDNLVNTLQVNVLAALILMNNFMHTYYLQLSEKIIVNVSSGAGKNPVDGWGVYCASKAALDMFSRVADLEQKVKGKHSFKIFSVAPGIVDTDMQAEIRNADADNFSRKEEFIQYKKTGVLSDVNAVAEKFVKIINSVNTITDVVISVKDY